MAKNNTQILADRAALMTVFSSLASEPKMSRDIMTQAHGIACDIESIDKMLAEDEAKMLQNA